MKILVYCLQRSGSNFLESLLKKHFKVKIINSDFSRAYPTQKHFRLYNDKDIIPEPQYKNDMRFNSFKEFENALKAEERPDYYVVISKNPYSWYKSYLKWAKKCNWPTPRHHYIAEYNLFYRKWLQFAQETDRIVFVRYKDILTNKEEELKRLEKRMNLTPKLSFNFLATLKVPHSGFFSSSKKHYYTNDEYLNDYSKQEMIELNNQIDESLLNHLGYNKFS